MSQLTAKSVFLPTAYVVRREGNILTRVCPSVSPHLRGVPEPGPDEGRWGTQRGYLPTQTRVPPIRPDRGYPMGDGIQGWVTPPH